MIALFLLLVITAIALGIVGVVVKGLFYLLLIGIAVFLAALRMRGRPRRKPGRLPARPSWTAAVPGAPCRIWAAESGRSQLRDL